MLWLTWRQHRLQAVVTAVLLVGLAVLLMADALPQDVMKALPWAPVLVGLFWGVPLLVREFERGTQRLAWTQSVSRRRWLTVKYATLAAAVTLAGLVSGAAVARWTPMDRLSSDVFGASGVVSAAWFLAVFALGAASGAALRRTLPAMAVTIAVFSALVVASYLGRDHYAVPVLAEQNLVLPPGAHLVDSGVRNAAGDRLTWTQAQHECTSEAVSCMRARGYGEQWVTYQPADRYWRFQWTETGLLVLITVLLTGVTAQRVLRRPL